MFIALILCSKQKKKKNPLDEFVYIHKFLKDKYNALASQSDDVPETDSEDPTDHQCRPEDPSTSKTWSQKGEKEKHKVSSYMVLG